MVKTVKTRVQNKHDLEVNWNNATFVPFAGELIVYDIEVDAEGNALTKLVDGVQKTVHELVGRDSPYTYERFKIGDGVTQIQKLPFATSMDNDIRLSEQFTITQDFGYYKLDGAASKKVGSVGQSLHQFLQGAFAAEDTTIFATSPSCGISMSGGSAEIGSTITPSASWSTGAGTYKWGTYSNGAANYSNKTTGITYSTGAITIDKSSFVISGSTTVTASGDAVRSAVTNYPCSNLGSDLTEDLAAEYKEEKTLSKTKTATFTCYRCGFYGTLETKAGDIDSDLVRSLGTKTTSAPAAGNSWTLSIPTGAIRVVFAYPATLRDVTSVVDAATKYDVKTSFTKYTVDVEGADGYTAASYKVYVSDFANANTEANTYTITI